MYPLRVAIYATLEASTAKYKVEHIIFSPEGKPVATIKETYHPQKKQTVTITQKIRVKHPELWSPDTPKVYKVVSKLYDEKEQISDLIPNPLSFRTLNTDNQKGILLNGKPVFIKGIGKHQDFDTRGYAVAPEINQKDMYLIKATGANLVRSHYPLAPECYDICDQNGIMVWRKIPVMDKITHPKAFIANTQHNMQELIYQNFNRPSFILWGFACEIFGDIDWYWPKPRNKKKMKENIQKTTGFC